MLVANNPPDLNRLMTSVRIFNPVHQQAVVNRLSGLQIPGQNCHDILIQELENIITAINDMQHNYGIPDHKLAPARTIVRTASLCLEVIRRGEDELYDYLRQNLFNNIRNGLSMFRNNLSVSENSILERMADIVNNFENAQIPELVNLISLLWTISIDRVNPHPDLNLDEIAIPA